MSARGRRNSCFVPGCKTGYSSTRKLNKLNGKKNPTLFKAPRDEVILNQWRRAIPRKDRQLTEIDVVCELHFPEEEIERNFLTNMSDGSVHKLERQVPILKSSAVPTIFPNLPHYLSKFKKSRKPPSVRHVENQSIEEIDTANEEMVMEDVTVFVNHLEHEQEQLFEYIKDNLEKVILPTINWSSLYLSHSKDIVFGEWNKNYQFQKQVIVHSNMIVQIFFGNIEINDNNLNKAITKLEDITHCLQLVNEVVLCKGLDTMSFRASRPCLGRAENNKRVQKRDLLYRCLNCQEIFRQQSKSSKVVNKQQNLRGNIKCMKQKNARLTQTVTRLVQDVMVLKNKCSTIEMNVVEDAIKNLPSSSQQEAVRACFLTSKLKNFKNRRYSTAWIYDCLLIRIKSKSTYEHLRKINMLPLPCSQTLNKYIKRVKGCYGFQSAIFDLLKKKSSLMAASDRRGVMLIDEMKLTEKVTFDANTLKINGFTNLGDYTSEHQKNQKGDHALVFMFQPFRGSWVQAIATFLSKGCASSTVLHHLILEAVILLEKAGFFVDVITTDGASWNRSMWRKFDIHENNVSCVHPFDESRKLWFTSDFPHLIKNFRNFVVKYPETWTPDGIVKINHWRSVVEADNSKEFNLKLCPKLCNEDINPTGYQKMNVGRAYRFFSDRTAAAMNIYKIDNAALKDSAPSVALISIMSQLISIMGSRIPDNALKVDSDEVQFLVKFINYLTNWHNTAKTSNYYFLSDSTYVGLIISLKATMEILSYLSSFHNFEYIMTARLNQDALEANLYSTVILKKIF